MKLSEHWLHEWIKPTLSREALCERMTMAGLEIESITPVAQPFSHVVIGKVLHVEKHPEADRLTVCEVDVGSGKSLRIVCGAQNVKAGIKIPLALVDAELPNQIKITKNAIRGTESHGMLCSAKELSLAEESEGLFILPDDAPLGKNVWDYLNLADVVIDVAITPNRGDCLSVKGLAQEIAALTATALHVPAISNVKSVIKDIVPVNIHEAEACPHYLGRIIRNVKADAVTPIWMQERLRRGDVRCISPIVDVMNYVMLELGQPMHAFDLNKISGSIEVRKANKSEKLTLLDGNIAELTPETLVIADNKNPLAIAGVMGGLDSAVTLLTKDIFLESAYFHPEWIARAGRQFNLTSDSSYRFERGVDPLLQSMAIERATQLLLEIVGGQAGPVIEVTEEAHLPQIKIIALRAARVEKILGFAIAKKEIENILTRLGFSCQTTSDGWKVTVPAARFDIAIEVDLIEEVLRLYGTDRVPLRHAIGSLHTVPSAETHLSVSTIRHVLCDLGYHEVITYSFVDQKLQTLLDPENTAKPLLNPITAEMDVMRTNLWPGLIKTLIYNLNRQQHRVRLFETGLRFLPHKQEYVLSGLVCGTAFPEQWGEPKRVVDFFDVKGDIQNLIKLTLASKEFTFKPGKHPALHPGQTAEIFRNGQSIGIMGLLHPTITQKCDLPKAVIVFEVALDALQAARVPRFTEISKFPEIRRDIAIFVANSVPAQTIQDTIIKAAGEWLKEVNLFDVYQGQNVSGDRKSIALSLTLQHGSRTLIDAEVAEVMERVIAALREQCTAELRG